MLHIKYFTGGYDKNFSYLIWCKESKEAAIVDPAVDIDAIINYINNKKLKLRKILITHTHADHIRYLNDIMIRYDNKLDVHLSNKTRISNFKTNNYVCHNEMIYLGSEKIKCLHTPGHYYDSVCFWSYKNNIIFTGDTMFVGRTGRTIHEGSNIKELYHSIYDILLNLPQETMILSGHDYGEIKCDTIGNNIKKSDFFSCKNFEQFLLVMENYEKRRKKQ